MVFLTPRFIHFFLVLCALGWLDGTPFGTGPIRQANAAPAQPVSARIGIVIKDGDSSTAASSVAPSRRGSAFEAYTASSVPPSRRGSAFEAYEINNNKDAVKVPLEHIDARETSKAHPMMLFQQHLNRANVKLAKMQKRSTPSPEDLTRALWNRRRSIEMAYGGGREEMIDPLSKRVEGDNEDDDAQKRSFKASTSDLPSNHGRIGAKVVSQMNDHHDQQKRLWPGIYNSFTGSTSAEEKKSASTHKESSDSAESASSVATKYAYSDTLLPAAKVTSADSLGLEIEANNIGYVATVQFGKQKTNFKMLIDSGSADTWIPSSNCQSCGSDQQKLSKKISPDLETSKQQWSITYGTGNAQGYLATDSLTIAGLTLKNYTFALTTQESSDFSSAPFDGLMGLAKEVLSNSHSPTPIDALYDNKLVAAPVMGYKLGDALSSGNEAVENDGEVTFGGVDASKYKGNLVEIPNVSTEGFFEIPIQGVSINNKTISGLSTGRTSILDTGTSLMVAPQADAEAVHAQIPGAQSDGQGGFTVPCNTTAVLSFKFGGVEWPLKPADLIFVPVNSNDPNGQCISSLGGGNVGQQGEWLVGAVALKRLYFATNAKENLVGLGKLR